MSIIKEVRKPEIKLCPSCNALFLKNRWQYGKDLAEHIRNILKTQIAFNFKQISFKIENIKKIIDKIGKKEKRIEAELSITALISDKKKTEHYFVPIRVIYEQCKNCSRYKSGYYEGVLQLRNRKNDDFEKVVNDTIKRLEHKQEFISNTVELKDGMDLYFSSNKLLQNIGKKLYETYGGEHKTSQSLFKRDHQTGKSIYRVTVLLRLPDMSRGDIVKVNKRLVLVKNIKKHTLIGIDLCTHNKIKVNYEHALPLLKKNELKNAHVSMVKPHLEVLHPETFQSTRIENPVPTKKEQVLVAEIDEKLYLVPFQ